jgi:predicted MFS family arabinose efflux permease
LKLFVPTYKRIKNEKKEKLEKIPIFDQQKFDSKVLYTNLLYTTRMIIPESSNGNSQSLKKRLFLPIVVLSVFLTWTFTVFFSTVLLDIAKSFEVSIGTASQALTAARFAGLLVGLAMGFLTIRFNHKSIFVSGVTVYGLGILGSFLSPNFTSLVAFQVFQGIGLTIVGIMSLTLIGDLLPLQKRGFAIGIVVSSGFLTYVLIPPLSSSITVIAGWRSVLVWFILPFSLVCLVLCWVIIPATSKQGKVKPQYLEAFKRILVNKSAVACVVSMALLTMMSSVPVYAVSFYRIHFLSSTTTAALYSSVAAVGGMLGGLIGGRLVNRFGRKPLTVTTAFVSSVFAILFTLLPNVLVSVAFWTICACSLSMTLVGLQSLVLEQVPKHRGSMVSVNSVFRSIGLVLGVAVGGIILNLFSNNFQLLMAIFGFSGIVSIPILLVIAKDPCTTSPTS